jgi:hypothetical protein
VSQYKKKVSDYSDFFQVSSKVPSNRDPFVGTESRIEIETKNSVERLNLFKSSKK